MVQEPIVAGLMLLLVDAGYGLLPTEGSRRQALPLPYGDSASKAELVYAGSLA